jgi:hypothetical protein
MTIRRTFPPKHRFYPFLIMVLPNNTIENHTIITTNAAPHLILSRAPVISFVTDACAGEVLSILGSATPADESFGVTGVSFFTKGFFGVLGSASAVLGGASVFDTPAAGGCSAANGSSA